MQSTPDSASAAPPPAPAAHQAPAGRAPAKGSTYRPEIQGLRAVAVLLVAVYHIWLGRVSGGVDVFLLLTGFLITGSLLRSVERKGGIGFTAFWTRMVKRLVPGAAVVLAGILTATYLFLPADRWRDVIAEVVAAALYYENWHLALNSVDYLARSGVASPVQHFWSLSIQGQFYLLWPFLIGGAAWLAARAKRPSPRGAVAVGLGLVFTASLAYSVVTTASQQAWAYFDLGARLWEFALGGLLALALPHLRLPMWLRVLLGWTGVAALVLCGLLVQVSTLFPGYIALWPTMAAVLVIAAGTTGRPLAVDRLLNLRAMHYVGDHAYALYLWHWPVLICYLEVTDRTLPSLTGGFAVLAVSMLLAVATRWITETRVDVFTRVRPARRWSLAVGAAFLVPVLAATGLWSGYLTEQQRQQELAVEQSGSYTGAQALTAPAAQQDQAPVPVYPAPADAADDVPRTYADGCNQETGKSEVLTCVYGPDDAEHTVALVGASHAAHWFPALMEIAEDRDWRVVNIIKGSCLFTDIVQVYRGEEYHSCAQWNSGVLDELRRLRPDAVFTTATSTSIDGEAGFGGEVVVEGYVDRWRELDRMGIDVVAVRDTPRMPFDAPECVAEDGPEACVADRSFSMDAESPLEKLEDVPDNVAFIDMTDHMCDGDRCPAVIGNILVYWDTGHITTTYMRTLAPGLGERIAAATDL
ncbi:acyltransferase family protein [Streptomonospora nanhaiensis]|uniref:acyltransferase family protein n=1 Tax=Streptomonospora nanhaiensis TaxID=1323731 RepID=UPI001C385978|nr:acyltransferase family protein [Streptomonospora nanhaiensis]MBV2362087.1 acyltransferase [Streptomonospora nanhaiensis]MBX9390438.1 acyltransferase family protein [Streptomonospora nanhaiensis]